MVVVDVCLLGFPNLCSGGVPGGVLDGELLLSGCIAKLSSSCSSSQIQLNGDSLIISVKPPPPTPPRERYFQFTQEAEIWYAS